jgi:ATP-dependent Clp protease ATP-binding subunit ClpB
MKKQKIKLTESAKNLILEQGYDIHYGARPLKRYISGHIETLIARKIIEGNIKYGDTIIIDNANNELIMK